MQELIDNLDNTLVKSIFERLEKDDLFKKALEKEKEQIKKAYKDHHDLGHIFGLDTEQYFNQTYNN
jgi:hypothetical protein